VPGVVHSLELLHFLHLSRPLKEVRPTADDEGEETKSTVSKTTEAEGFPRQPPSQFEVSVVSSRTVVRTGYPHVTYYTIRTTAANNHNVEVEKRFDEFKSLNAAVRYNFATGRSSHLVQNVPVFPSSAYKLFTNHADPVFVENRRQQLEKYLNALILVPHATKDIHLLYFLGLWTRFRPVVGTLSRVY